MNGDDKPKPIQRVDTTTAAFIGTCESGPTEHASLIQSPAEFVSQFGPAGTHWLGHSVRHFFDNGGKAMYVARAAGSAEADYQSAFALLNGLADISIVATPGMSSPSLLSFASAYCAERRDCVFLGDVPESVTSSGQALSFFNQLSLKSSFATLYFPWVREVRNQIETKVPPSGFVAGIYARIDSTRGVWKAPAGIEASLQGATSLANQISDSEQEQLAAAGINPVRKFPSHPVVLWGGRTLGATTEPDWKYVNVRRLGIFIERSILKGTEWAVNEPNDEKLWLSVQRLVEDFLFQLFRDGALRGIKPQDAFFVQIGRNTTAQEEIDAGRFNILIGFAPLKPAEFVNLRIGQWAKKPEQPSGPASPAPAPRRGCLPTLALLPFTR